MTDAAYHRELERGDVLDEAYRVVRLIARGGMGHVYEAEQLRLDRRVALKILSVDPQKSSEFLPRFRREAEICAKLSHPNIIAVLDWNVAHGMPYLVMEYLEGEDLGMRIRRSTLDLGDALHILEGIAAGLVAAHAAGVVHRDLKPSNIFLCNVGMPRPHVKLLDFGVSKVTWEATLSTTSPKVLGSPRYMAPEQARGAPNLDARVDQFALGTVAYEMLSGSFAFDGDSLSSVLYRVVHEQPLPLETRAPHLPLHLVQTIARAMAKDPADRFQDIPQFMTALRGEVPPDVAHRQEERAAASQTLAPEPVVLTAKEGIAKTLMATQQHQPTPSQPWLTRQSLQSAQPTRQSPQSAQTTQHLPAAITQVEHRLSSRTIVAIAAVALVLAAAVWRIGPILVSGDQPMAPSTVAQPGPSAGTQSATTTAQSKSTEAANDPQQTTALAQTPSDPTARAPAKRVPEKHVVHKTGQKPESRSHVEEPSFVPPPSNTAITDSKASTNDNAQAQRLIGEAQKLYDAGDYRESVIRARQALGYQDAPRAHILIVLAYCRMSSIGDARAEMFGVRPQDKPGVVTACAKYGVDISD